MFKFSFRLLAGILLISAGMTGCGYHLRGSVDMPEAMKNVYIFGASSQLQTQMQSIVRASKGKVVGSPNDAGVVVKVLKEDMRRRTLSIGSTGKSNESELEYYLRFQMYDNQEKPLMEEQTIEMSREFFNDQTAILAKTNEEQLIRSEMYKQVARMLLARARIAVDNQKK
ncbi:LPS assembly lipoprotein LptE [Methylomonas sp. UP202]|uniref:LPS-assembly lipoprotein LptE n=1 Tax=Methylomonas sp. UP202 TaxID=3040943 RepID=UPI002479B073|nr:LPS assembly lipoprotein LptE [Methylomonas sp. UP202]WGS85171.1 LPS assembly lipoprotein LptE [Methylomonas sp. UP202]